MHAKMMQRAYSCDTYCYVYMHFVFLCRVVAANAVHRVKRRHRIYGYESRYDRHFVGITWRNV